MSSIPTNEINQVTQNGKTFSAFVLGVTIGGLVCWFFMDKYLTEHQKSLEKDNKNLTEKVKTLESNLTEKSKIKSYTKEEVAQNFIPIENYNTCLSNKSKIHNDFNIVSQNNKNCKDENQKLYMKNIDLQNTLEKNNIELKAYNDCRNDRNIWQKKLNQINEELDYGYGRFTSGKTFTDSDIKQRQEQRQQYAKLLDENKCYINSISEKR